VSKQTAFYVSSFLAIGTLLLYWPAGHYDFVLADDYEYICHNPPVLRCLSWEGIRWAIWSMYASNWHPLTWVSHMVDCSMYGLYPGGHHLTNIFLHTANVALLFRWLSRLTGKLWPSAFVAAFFAWHPLHVESVAWICERKDVLSTFFLLLTLGAYTRYVAKPTRGRLFLTLLLFVLGLMAKPMLVTLPCLLLLLDYWPLNRFQTETGQLKARKEWLPVLVEKIPFFFLSFCGCLLTMAAQSASGAVKQTSEISVLVRVVNAVSSYGRYLGKAFWPDRLLIFYPMPTATPWALFAISLVVLVAVTAVAFWWRAKFPWFIVGWFWFLGTLVPVIGLVQVGDQAMADRYTYIPYIGLFIVVVWAFDALRRKHVPVSPEDHLSPASRRREGQPGGFGKAIALLGVAALVACGIRTRAQLGYWKDSITVFGHTAQFTSFNKFSHANLNYALAQKKYPDPVPRYKAVLRPEAPNTSKGAIVFDTDAIIRVDDGVIELSELLNYDPDSAPLRNNLGILLAEQQKSDDAIEQFDKAIALDPRYAWAYFNEAIVLRERGRLREAGERMNEAVRLKPGLVGGAGREP
jgi:protein O-mannosyl-transferase